MSDLRNEFTNLHPMHKGLPEVRVAISTPPARWKRPELEATVDRICRAYLAASRDHRADDASLWTHIEAKHFRPFHDALRRHDVASTLALLEQMFTGDVTHGFDQNGEMHRAILSSDHATRAYVARCRDMLVRLGEALGLLTVENPEQGKWAENLYATDTDRLIVRIGGLLGFAVTSVKVAKDRIGLATPRGIFAEKDLHALYTASRIRTEIHGNTAARVCEIGGGTGRVAHYATLAGVAEYTIVDLPIVNAVQAWFTMHARGPESVRLHGEGTGGGVRIVPPSLLREVAGTAFDLVVNQDSLPELGREVALAYVRFARDHARRFLSINHEAETQISATSRHQVVARLAAETAGMRRLYRSPYWLRTGYVEELYEAEPTG